MLDKTLGWGGGGKARAISRLCVCQQPCGGWLSCPARELDVAVLTSDGTASIIKAVLVNFRARDVANHR